MQMIWYKELQVIRAVCIVWLQLYALATSCSLLKTCTNVSGGCAPENCCLIDGLAATYISKYGTPLISMHKQTSALLQLVRLHNNL